jgi:shikimate dehydrogenase
MSPFSGKLFAVDWQELNGESGDRLRIAVIGDPSDSELIADVFTAALREMKIPHQVAPLDVRVDEFHDCISHLAAIGFKGVSVGNPHKPMAAKLASSFFVVKHSLGVANALQLGTSIYAQNTEVAAFESKIAELTPGTALVMGSGRAARSVVMGLLESGWKIRLWNRNVMRSRPFLTLFQRYGEIEMLPEADPSGCSLIVNATSLGTRAGEQPPVKWTFARPHTTACDLVYRRVATDFLRSAMQRGFKTIDGRELMLEQAALALEWWCGEKVPREAMRRAVGLVRDPGQITP